MEFCPHCEKRLTLLSGKTYRCSKCGYTTTLARATTPTEPPPIMEKAMSPILLRDPEETRLQTLPTIHVNCPQCPNTTASYWTSAVGTEDDVELIHLFRCTQCGHRWRQEE